MSELEVIATFDTTETARAGAKLLNSWFAWIVEGAGDDADEIEALFDDFGLSIDDYTDLDTDTDLGEILEAHVEGNKIVVGVEKTGVDTIKGLFEAMGAFDVRVYGEDD